MTLIGNQNSPDEHLSYEVLLNYKNKKIQELKNEIKKLKKQLNNCNCEKCKCKNK
jgi:hypothetical protein